MSQLNEHVAIVTGGGRGIGRVIALALAKAGASVAVTARTEAQLTRTVELIDAAGGRAMAIPCDVCDGTAVRWMARKVASTFGAVDLLINNAAMGTPLGSIATVDPGEWWRCFEVNLRGPFYCTQAVLPAMLARGQGRIINIASGAGTFPIPNMSAYATSKTGLIRFTETLALEIEPHGLKAFSISPGAVRTAMTSLIVDDPEAAALVPWLPKLFEENKDVPAELCGELVLKIASGECDALSGRFLHITEDLNDLVRRADDICRADLYTLRLKKEQ